MDALKIKECTDLIFKSQNDNAHMCGHDLHTAILLGIAKLLKPIEAQLGGTIKFMFQGGEEIGQGAIDMIHAGVLDGPHVDVAMAIHVDSNKPLGKCFTKMG